MRIASSDRKQINARARIDVGFALTSDLLERSRGDDR
jgi:hypothetical protein